MTSRGEKDSVKKVVMIKVPEKFEDLPSTEDQQETGKIRIYTLQHFLRPYKVTKTEYYF